MGSTRSALHRLGIANCRQLTQIEVIYQPVDHRPNRRKSHLSLFHDPISKCRNHSTGPTVDRVLVSNTWCALVSIIVFDGRHSNNVSRNPSLTCVGLCTSMGYGQAGWWPGSTMTYSNLHFLYPAEYHLIRQSFSHCPRIGMRSRHGSAS